MGGPSFFIKENIMTDCFYFTLFISRDGSVRIDIMRVEMVGLLLLITWHSGELIEGERTTLCSGHLLQGYYYGLVLGLGARGLHLQLRSG